MMLDEAIRARLARRALREIADRHPERALRCEAFDALVDEGGSLVV